jgi:hypothetical protein
MDHWIKFKGKKYPMLRQTCADLFKLLFLDLFLVGIFGRSGEFQFHLAVCGIDDPSKCDEIPDLVFQSDIGISHIDFFCAFEVRPKQILVAVTSLTLPYVKGFCS